MKLLILIVIFGFVVGCRKSRTHLSMAATDADSLAAALKAYYQTTGELPTEDQGLGALVLRPDNLAPTSNWVPLASAVPNDPWGNLYEYAPLTGGDKPKFEIRSLGPDGIRSEDDSITTFHVDLSKMKGTN